MKNICDGDAYSDCDKKPDYVRYTQFSGNHYFCEEHAKAQKDFMINDSYQSWEKITK